MRNKLSLTILLLFLFTVLKSQWNGANPIWTNSNIGIGTTNPGIKTTISRSLSDTHWNALNIANVGSWSLAQGKHANLIFGNNDSEASGNPVAAIGATYDGYGRLDFHSFYNGGFRSDNDIIMSIRGNGTVGIGTVSPSVKFEVSANHESTRFLLHSTDVYDSNMLLWAGTPGISYTMAGIGNNINPGGPYFGRLNNSMGASLIYLNTGTINLRVITETGTEYDGLTVVQNGNVGIGTTTPGNYRLNVSGRIRADEVVVNTSGADYVFGKAYKLLTLPELEKFINENKRLPGLSSAKEMQREGMNVSEMQTKLLEKIEELVLYLLDQNRKIELQNLKIKSLEDKVK